MIRIKHNLRGAIDDVESVPIDLLMSLQEALKKTRQDAKEKIAELVPDKAHWFEVVVDEATYNIRITPTSTTAEDPDKMRLYKYLVEKHGEEIGYYTKTMLHWNMRFIYRANARGVGYGY